MQVCWYHALSNEKEEMMGVLIGQKRGTGVHFSTLKASVPDPPDPHVFGPP